MATKNIAQIEQVQPMRSIPMRRTGRYVTASCGLVLLSVLIAGLILSAGAAAYGYYWFEAGANRIQPGVTVDQVSIGDLPPQDAAKRLDQAWNTRSITMTDGKTAWQTSPAFLGLWFDPAATIAQAPVIASSEISWEAIQSRWEPVPVALQPMVRFDRAVAENQLSGWAAQVNRPAQDATLRLENGQPVVTPAQEGIRLDVSATLDAIAANPLTVLTTQKAVLFFTPVQPTVTDLSAEVEKINTLLSQKFGGEIYDPITDERIPWQIPQEQVQSWVQLSQETSGYQAAIERTSLVAYLADLPSHVDLGADRTIDSPADANALADQVLAGQAPVMITRYLPTEYTVQQSETLTQVGWKVGIQLWRLQKANPGVNSNALTVGQKLVIPAKTDLLPLPVVLNKRIVISITDQRMRVFENGEQIHEFIISTGIANSPTQPGVYQVQTHDINAYASNWDLWMPHWMGIYEAWPDFMNGIHGLPKLSSGVRLWANVLGKPASYGCIILNLDDAAWLYDWAEDGVVVEIQR
jgi:hypothetical protein